MNLHNLSLDDYPADADIRRFASALDSPHFDADMARACCKTCGMATFAASAEGRPWAAYVLMDGEMNEPDFDTDGRLTKDAYVSWGVDSSPIVEALRHAGFEVLAPPDASKAIRVSLPAPGIVVEE